jgi:hypothetical protein
MVSKIRCLGRQEKWGLFVQLHEAEEAHAPEAVELFKRASKRYRTEPIWRHCEATRGRFRLFAIDQPTCPACRERLPLAKEHAVKTGDPVACSCGAILMLQQ